MKYDVLMDWEPKRTSEENVDANIATRPDITKMNSVCSTSNDILLQSL